MTPYYLPLPSFGHRGLLAAALTLAATTTSTLAQTVPVNGTQLEIGSSGSNQVADSVETLSGAIGSNNNVSAPRSLAVGLGNTLTASGANNIALGANSIITGAENSGTFGSGHDISSGDSCFLFGLGNELWKAGSAPAAVASLATGSSNRIINEVQNGFLAGCNNELNAFWQAGISIPLESASALGRGLINQWNHSTIVGQFNASDIPRTSGLLFAVGNGTTASQRSNALEVYADGRVRMAPQGDIPMGDFGH